MSTVDSKDNSNENSNKILFNWKFLEYENYERSFTWYVVAAILMFLLFVYSIVTDNFIFAIIIILFCIIFINYSKKDPSEIDFNITDKGISINEKFYSYNELNKFCIIDKAQEVKKLYFGVKGVNNSNIFVPITNVSSLDVRSELEKYLEEDLDKEDEPISETLSRIMKI